MTQRCKSPATPKAAAACCRPIDGLLDVELFRALGDPTRLRLLACLLKCARACTVSEIGEGCEVDLSVVSRHLKTLADAGILVANRNGRTVTYAVAWQRLAETLRRLAASIEDCCGPGEIRRPQSRGVPGE